MNTDGEDHAPDALRYGLVFFSKRISSLSEVKNLNEVNKEREKARARTSNTPIIATKF